MIEIQNTADENVLNFYSQTPFIQTGLTEFVTLKSLRKSPLAEAIFDIGGIEQVLIAENMISVHKKNDTSWDNIKSLIMAEIVDYITTGQQIIINNKEEDSENILEKIEALIEARIRPAIKKDGGDIIIEKFEEGILFIKLTGNCSGCPYAMITIKEGIEKILKNYIPQVKEVKPMENI